MHVSNIFPSLIATVPLIFSVCGASNSISDFVHSTRQHYDQITASPLHSEIVHFVIGNESADLDSIISSIAYAYLLNQKELANQTNGLYIPLLNINREEMVLRRDITYLLQLLGISTKTLLFLDDNSPLHNLFVQERVRVNLVDHNTLRPSQRWLSDVVERIVDHHVDENNCYPLVSSEDKLVATAGSNTTLITNMLFKDQITISPEFALLLLAPILIDTSNLEDKITTELDIQIAESLKNLASSLLPTDFYETLSLAKDDISGLTPKMLLSKDFKEYLDGQILYGISSMPSSVQWCGEDFEMIIQNLQELTSERKLAYLILLMESDDPEIGRKIVVYSLSPDLLEAFDAYIQTDEVLKDILILDALQKELQLCSYISKKSISRKQLQPLFHFSENERIRINFDKFR